MEQVDYLLRGVSVPAGAHVVVFRYQPASWRAGWIVSLIALVVIIGAAAIGLHRRRRSSSPAGGRRDAAPQ